MFKKLAKMKNTPIKQIKQKSNQGIHANNGKKYRRTKEEIYFFVLLFALLEITLILERPKLPSKLGKKEKNQVQLAMTVLKFN